MLTTMQPLQTYSKELVEIPEAAVEAESMTAALAVITTQTRKTTEHAAAVVTMAGTRLKTGPR